MNTLKANLDKLDQVNSVLTNGKGEYFSVDEVNYDKYPISAETISIAMTTHNRSRQLYFTLDTIAKSQRHKNVQVILVDDSSDDKIVLDKLVSYPFAITFIQINRDKKCWHNPCVNYNIGFQHIKGTKVIIQNGEVCHVGDVLTTLDNIQDGKYYVYDVKASKDFQANNQIYDAIKQSSAGMLDISIYGKPALYAQWYQHIQHRNANYHFLTACTKATFDKIGGFSMDYAFGSAYDDDDFVLKIKQTGTTIQNMCHDRNNNNCGGIHLFHKISGESWDTKEQNITILHKKRNYIARTGKYIEISTGATITEKLAKYNELNTY